MFDAKPLMRPGMKGFRFREEVCGQACDPVPRQAILLAAKPEYTPPDHLDVVKESVKCREVGWHGVVRKVATHNLR
ncbi:MAG TPA: hypothetical protein VH744_14430, partial [Terriglobales bacterium]